MGAKSILLYRCPAGLYGSYTNDWKLALVDQPSPELAPPNCGKGSERVSAFLA